MANTIGTAQFDDSIPDIVAAEALGYLKGNCVMSRLVNRDYESDVAQYGDTVFIPYGGTATVQDKGAGTAVTLQQLADAKYTVTLDKHKEITILIEDPAKAFARPNWLNRYMVDHLALLAEQVDSDLTALYSGFSQTIDATTGLGEDDFRNARRLLNAAKVPLANRRAVLHEDAEYEALGIDRIVNRDYAESLGNMAAEAYINRFTGFDIFLDQQVAVAATQAKNLFFQRDAMVLATRPLPAAPAGMGVVQSVMVEDEVGLRVTASYSADHLGVQLTVDVLYGVAELRDNHGVVVSTAEI